MLLFLLLVIPFQEKAFSNTYLYETAPGTYECSNCHVPLFSSENKYDSGAGWPSFTQPIAKESIYYLEDRSLPFKRYAVHCQSCNTALGHVFNDGPPPKNFRYCIKSANIFLHRK